MSQLLEILGRGIRYDVADLIWHWFEAVRAFSEERVNNPYEELQKAIELACEKKYEAAEKQLKLYLFEEPTCVYGRMAAAALLLQNNQVHEAIGELNSVYMRQPSNTMALYALGHCYERLGMTAEAVEFYQDCLKFKNYLLLPRQRLGAIYFKNGQIEKTITEYEMIRREHPDEISSLVTLGYLYIAAGENEKASTAFNTAILIHPDNFYAVDQHIDELILSGQFYEAAEELEKQLEKDSSRGDLIAKYADVLANLGGIEESIAQYEKVLGMYPDFLEARIKLGTQYVRAGHDDWAAEQFNRGVETNDRIVDAYIGLSLSKKLCGENEEAFQTLSLAAAIQPNSSILYSQAATLHFKLTLAENSVTELECDDIDILDAVIDAHHKELIEQPNNPDMHYRRGVLMMSLRRFSEAITSFQSTLQINPTFSRAKSKLSICLLEVGEPKDGMKQLEPVEYPSEEMLELYYKVALLHCDKAKFASSLINLERNMDSNFATSEITTNVSVVLQNLELLDRATAMWDNLSDTATHAIREQRL
jgi:tetratricopeptide (TPR) repeat protein